jgi:hypothetical protein
MCHSEGSREPVVTEMKGIHVLVNADDVNLLECNIYTIRKAETVIDVRRGSSRSKWRENEVYMAGQNRDIKLESRCLELCHSSYICEGNDKTNFDCGGI